jgi:hypothetical protein
MATITDPIPYDKQIENILDWFDFAYVLRAMELLDWRWATSCDTKKGVAELSVPGIGDLRQTARRHLQAVAKGGPDFHSGSGGFMARNVEGRLSLEFVLTECDTFDMEPEAVAAETQDSHA